MKNTPYIGMVSSMEGLTVAKPGEVVVVYHVDALVLGRMNDFASRLFPNDIVGERVVDRRSYME